MSLRKEITVIIFLTKNEGKNRLLYFQCFSEQKRIIFLRKMKEK